MEVCDDIPRKWSVLRQKLVSSTSRSKLAFCLGDCDRLVRSGLGAYILLKKFPAKEMCKHAKEMQDMPMQMPLRALAFLRNLPAEELCKHVDEIKNMALHEE